MSNISYDLIPVHGITEVSKVLTEKLNRHEVNEWKYGISWTRVLSSLKKHLTAFELGEDYTEEKLLNIAEVAANALILCEYYSIYPQGDDRIIAPVNKPIIGCEVYVAPRTRFDKEPGIDDKLGHMILLAKDNRGYQNLIKIVSKSFLVATRILAAG